MEIAGFAGPTAASMVIVLLVLLALRVIFMEAVIVIPASDRVNKFLVEL